MGAFTIEKVARRSGASKMTIYKWWPSKGALALDGYFHKVEPQLAFPDTGDIEADLRTQLHAFVGSSATAQQAGWSPSWSARLRLTQTCQPGIPRAVFLSAPPLAVDALENGQAPRPVTRPTWTMRRSWTSSGAPATTGCCCRISR